MSASVNTTLAAAVRRINAIYSQIPEAHRPDVYGSEWLALERDVARRVSLGDETGALLAIAEWLDFAECLLSSALAHAPLERAA